jgi:hypothetical protein
MVDMAKYMMLYTGPATPMEEFTPEQSEQQMQAWGAWMGKVGDALLDMGSPFGERGAVRADGGAGTPGELNGYSIVEAADLDAAKALCEGHPFLSDGRDVFSVEIFELVPVEM